MTNLETIVIASVIGAIWMTPVAVVCFLLVDLAAGGEAAGQGEEES